ncbi:MAG TPA: hypothetical protein DDY75_04500 [Sphingobacterium sp.]|nr:hypothetical protein [Sphingobacterium sp.]
MENSICKERKGGEIMVYRNNDIMVNPAIQLATYLSVQISSDQRQVSSWKDFRKEHRKDKQSAVSSPKVNLCRPVGSKFIFLQCKKPFPHAPQCGERRMLPMVAVRKLGEVCQ